MVERDTVTLRQPRSIVVIRHNQRDIHAQLPGSRSKQQIRKTMQLLAHQDQHFWLLRHRPQRQIHLQGSAQVIERGGERGRVEVSGEALAEVHAHEEGRGGGVGKLLGFEDVEGVLGQEPGDGVDDAGAVGAGEGQDVVVGGAC